MRIVVFCEKLSTAAEISNKIVLGICDHVNGRTSHGGTRIEIDSKNICVDIRKADKEKSAGMRPDYALLYDTSTDFDDYWRFTMYGRYTELRTVDEIIELIIKED